MKYICFYIIRDVKTFDRPNIWIIFYFNFILFYTPQYTVHVPLVGIYHINMIYM